MNFTKIKYKETDFFLHNSCSKWFCLPEKDVYDFIDSLSEKDIFYDLGSAEGRFTIYAMKKKIKTVSFEPDIYNYNILIKNLKKNNLNTDYAFKIAVSDKNQKIKMLKGQPWEGGHLKILDNCERINTFEIKDTELVDSCRLDDFIIKNNIPAPTCLKIDIDGSEINFIMGASNILKNASQLYIELYSTQINIISILKNKFKYKIIKKTPIYSTKGNQYENLYNYWFSK